MPVPDPIHIYRMVHWENVAYILEHGMCCREHENADPNYMNIGHRQLIADRHDEHIDFPGAGNLGEYVPFYFAGHSPMLLKIRSGHGNVEQRPQNDIVFIVSTYDIIENANLEFVFSDMNAKRAIATFYNQKSDLNNLSWEYIQAEIWRNTNEHLNRQDRKQAEFLVRNHVPVECISALVVFTENHQAYYQTLVDKLNLSIQVFVDTERKLYY